MRSRWGAIANPHANVFDPPQAPPPLGHYPNNRVKILFNIFLLFVRTRTKFGIKIFEIDMVTEI